MSEEVTCSGHGPQEAACVCRHLVESLTTRQATGFYYASELRGDAWCSACEEVRLREGGESGNWNDRSEAFADIILICGARCDGIRKLNGF